MHKGSGDSPPLIKLSFIKCFIILESYVFLRKQAKNGHVVNAICQQRSCREFKISI